MLAWLGRYGRSLVMGYQGGLGIRSLDSGEMRETELLWASVLTSVIIALTVFWSTSTAEKRLLHWTRA